jgi:uncharacterized membrane protein
MRDQIICTAVGAVLIALGIPLARRRVRPNPLYGLRIPATLADEHVWYEANALAGRDLIVLGAVLAGTGLLLPIFVRSGTGDHMAVCAAILLGGSILGLIRGWRFANRLRRSRQGRQHSSEA